VHPAVLAVLEVRTLAVPSVGSDLAPCKEAAKPSFSVVGRGEAALAEEEAAAGSFVKP
jgi:hypothetical protein